MAKAKGGKPEREWPVHFPDGCPDSSTTPTDRPLYRLVCGDDRDWKSATELDEWRKKPKCERASLSCFLEAAHAIALRDTFPKFDDHKIAKATLDPKHGQMKRTGQRDGHVSLWLRDQFIKQVKSLFRVIE